MQREKNCQVARTDVDFCDRLAVNRHCSPLLGREDLIAFAEMLAIEPTTQIPIEVRIVAVVEDANISFMRSPSQGLLGEELVQFLDRAFQYLDDGIPCELHRPTCGFGVAVEAADFTGSQLDRLLGQLV